jgi:hypothetical protein
MRLDTSSGRINNAAPTLGACEVLLVSGLDKLDAIGQKRL